MSEPVPDVEWAKANRARFEIVALTELVGGKQVQVGFTITLFARLPMGEKDSTQRQASGGEIQARLRQVAKAALTPPEGGPARLDIRPPRQAAVLSPEGGMEPEVTIEAHLVHSAGHFTEVSNAERDSAYAQIRKRLGELGLKEGQR